MQAAIIVLVLALVAAGLGFLGYRLSRARLREAKGFERRLKMVPLLIHLPPSSDDTDVGSRDVRDVVDEKISQAETLYNVIASTAKKGFKSKFYGQRHISFEVVAIKGVINYYVSVPVAMEAVVRQAVLSAYPTAQLEESFTHNIFNNVGKITSTIGGELNLIKEYAYPIATFKDLKRDAMQSLLNGLGALGDEDGAALQILIRPAMPGWEKRVKAEAASIKKNKGSKSGLKALFSVKDATQLLWKPPESGETKAEDKQLSSLEQSTVDAIENKTRAAGYEVLIRIVCSSNTVQKSQTMLNNLVATFSLFNAQGLNGFKFTEAKDIQKFATAYIMRLFPPELNKNILNSTELATIFHLPDAQFTPISQLQRQSSKQVDGPHNIPREGQLLGYNVFRALKKEIRLSEDDRRRHMYIVGQTGTGKSVFLENLALQDMLSGHGFAFIDPHGDSVEALISMVPKERTEDVVYFNPGDLNFPLGFNLFEYKLDEQKDFLIQETINMLYRLYDPQHQGIIGPRYEHWFRMAALTVMANPKGGTFIDIPKVFTDKQFQKECVKHLKDQIVLDFWNKEMAQTSDYHKSEILGWFVSKFGAFMANEMMRNIIGQTKSSFDLREIMDEGKILLVNLSKGRVGELNSMLLGMMFVMKFQAAAMSRAAVPQDQRRDFSLYVDEFQNFSTDSFATILSEARKYRLNLIVANQFIGQLTEEIRDAVFGNVGTIISLRCGATDADYLVKQFSPIFDTQDLIKLPNYNAVVRLMVSGVPSTPFSMETIAPLGNPNNELGTALKQLSAAKYGRPKKVVEKDIFDRLATPPPPTRPMSSAFGSASGGAARPTAGTFSPPPRTTAASPTAATPPLGKSSFLDEWLAKRKNATGAANTGGPRPSSTPSSPATAPSPTTVAPAAVSPPEINRASTTPPAVSQTPTIPTPVVAPSSATPRPSASQPTPSPAPHEEVEFKVNREATVPPPSTPASLSESTQPEVTVATQDDATAGTSSSSDSQPPATPSTLVQPQPAPAASPPEPSPSSPKPTPTTSSAPVEETASSTEITFDAEGNPIFN